MPVTSSTYKLPTTVPARQIERNRITQNNDGARMQQQVAQPNRTSVPMLNTQGQTTGRILNTIA